MKLRKSLILVGVVLVATIILPVSATALIEESPLYTVRGTDTHLIGEYGDNFQYNGDVIHHVRGGVTIIANNDSNRGLLVAKIRAPEGIYLVIMHQFVGTMPFMDGGIASNLYLHGDTGNGPPLMPKVWTYLAGWGSANVFLSGEFLGTFDGHFMVSQGARDDLTHKIYNADKTAPYSPMDPANGYVDPNDLEVHLVFHSEEPDPDNFPPYTLFKHFNWEDIRLRSAAQ